MINTVLSMESAMNNLNWEAEHERFMTVAYDRTMTAAKRAFYGWHTPKKDDAVAECMARCGISGQGFSMRGQESRTHALWIDQVRHPLGQIRPPDCRAGSKRRHLRLPSGLLPAT